MSQGNEIRRRLPADGPAFLKVSKIIGRQKRIAIVVSAVSGVTELLLAAIEQSKQSEKNIPAILARLTQKHQAIIAELCLPGREKQRLLTAINSQLAQVRRLLTGIAYHGDLTPAVRARLLSYGERLAARLLAGLLDSQGRKAKALDAHLIGICTDDNFENASIDRERTRKKLGRPGQAAAAGRHHPGHQRLFRPRRRRGDHPAGPQRLRLQRRRRRLRAEGRTGWRSGRTSTAS